MTLHTQPEERIWEQILIPSTPGGCWLWQGMVNANGYGLFYTGRKGTRLAHRLIFMFAVRDDIDDLMVCHKCDVRTCVNPLHLFLGTAKTNSLDAAAKGRLANRPRPVDEKHHQSKLSQEQVVLLRDLRAQGWSYPKLAKRFGVNVGNAFRIATGKTRASSNSENLAPRVLKPRRRLITTEVIKIRELRSAGYALSEIAQEFDIHKTAVFKIAAGKTWRHIKEGLEE